MRSIRFSIRQRATLALSLLLLCVAPALMLFRVSADDSPIVLQRNAVLLPPSGGVNPHGTAEYKVYQNGNRELEIEIEDMDLANGTILRVFINGNLVGQTMVNLTKARLNLRTRDGQSVPEVTHGALLEVKKEDLLVVRGTFTTITPAPSASPTSSPTASPSSSPTVTPAVSPSPGEFEIFAQLNGAPIDGIVPRGLAEYEQEGSEKELEVRVRQINLPNGSSLGVFINDTQVGTMSILNAEAALRLRAQRGDNIPTITSGTNISIRSSSTVILRGIFGISGQPSPTSTQGRFFQAHLDGSQLNPPVNTTGRGELKIFLSADETQAFAIGEYENLIGQQISAKIICQVGSIPTIIHDFGALGGTERHYTASFAINAQQLQMLRTGVCYELVASTVFPSGEIKGTLFNEAREVDFDGDGAGDLAVFRPSNGMLYIQTASDLKIESIGSTTSRLISADFDGDGISDIAVYRNLEGLGVWRIKRSSDSAITTVQFGLGDDIPVAGDFDGDKINDLAVFRPSNGFWYIRRSADSSYVFIQFGKNGDIPLSNDMDGDGKSDIIIFRPSLGDWYILKSSDNKVSGLHFGVSGDIPIRADFDGDGIGDVAIYRPSEGTWYWVESSNNTFRSLRFGLNTDFPVAIDYDRDGRTDIAVFRPFEGIWYLLRSSDGGFEVRNFGINGDIPVTAQ